jgi:hypothetical protein
MNILELYETVDGYQRNKSSGIFSMFASDSQPVSELKTHLQNLKTVGGQEVQPWHKDISLEAVASGQGPARNSGSPVLGVKDAYPLFKILITDKSIKDYESQTSQDIKKTDWLETIVLNRLLIDTFGLHNDLSQKVNFLKFLLVLKKADLLTEPNFSTLSANRNALTDERVLKAVTDSQTTSKMPMTQQRLGDIFNLAKSEKPTQAILGYIDQQTGSKHLEQFDRVANAHRR